MLENEDVRLEVMRLLEKPSHDSCKEHIIKLLYEQNHGSLSEEAPLLNGTMIALADIYKDPSAHPRTKLQSNLVSIRL